MNSIHERGADSPNSQLVRQDVQATSDGTGAGEIHPKATFVNITAVASDANDIVTLPDAASSVEKGKWIDIYAAVSCELRTPASSNATIGGLDSDGTDEVSLLAGRLYRIYQVDENAWHLVSLTSVSPEQVVSADDAEVAGLNLITSQFRVVRVGAVTNDADDFVVLPAIASVPIGHTITIFAEATSNFELRTPATSGTTINGEDCDGTKEYLVTDTDVVVVTKVSATGWIGVSYTALGAVRTAVVPD